jgi:hypothetical protein
MGTSITTAMPDPQVGAEHEAPTLSRFLSMQVSEGSCFCCGSPTELMLDGSGLVFVRCSSCGAEISAVQTAGEAACGENNVPVLQAA